MTDRYKKNTFVKNRVSAKEIKVTKNSYIFLHNTDFETPNIDI